jgi:hypothetical protein
MRTHLYDAVTTLNHSTTQGTFNILVFSNARIDVADVHVVTVTATGSECGFQWLWHPLLADAEVGERGEGMCASVATSDPPSPPQQHGDYPNYQYNPPPETTTVDGITVSTWKHLSGSSHAVGYTVVSDGGGEGWKWSYFRGSL